MLGLTGQLVSNISNIRLGTCTDRSSTMTTAPVPRFLLLRGIYFGPQSIPRIPCSGLRKLQHCSRNGSAAAPPSKPRALEKPTKFYPPSHPQRLAKRRTPRHYPGPPLSEAQKEDQKTKRYPNTMPAEGTFMHWFLNNRLLHMSITLVILAASPRCSISLLLICLVDHTLRSCFYRLY